MTDRTQKIILKNTSSDRIGLQQSVLQDTVLEPLLFNLYVNSMQIIADKTCKLVKHADDIYIYIFLFSTNVSTLLSNVSKHILLN